jgi:hypothetical protein
MVPEINYLIFPDLPPFEMHITIGSFVKRQDGLGFRTDVGGIFPGNAGRFPSDLLDLYAILGTGNNFGAYAVSSADTLLASFDPQLAKFQLSWAPKDESHVAEVIGRPTFLWQVAEPPPVIPEPGTIVLVASGLALLANRARRRKGIGTLPTALER